MDDRPKFRRLLGPAGLALSVVTLAVLGCKEEAKATAEPVGVASAAPAAVPADPAPGASEAASKRFDEGSFTLAIEPVGKYSAGKLGEVNIVLDAKGGYKCNDKYPYKFKAKESAGVKFASMVVKKDAVAIEGKRATMPVAFTPESGGRKTIAGRFSFSVCTEERCLVEKRDLSIDVTVD